MLLNKIKKQLNIRSDAGIWTCYLMLLGLSAVFVFTSIGKLVYGSGGSVTVAIVKHLFIILISIGACFFSQSFDYKRYSRLDKLAYGFAVILLLFTLVLGHLSPSKAASRWIGIGFLQFQPSEIAKYIAILYTATQLAIHQKNIKEKKVFVDIFFRLVVLCALIFFENLSTAALIFATCFLLMILGRINGKYIFRVVLAVAGAIVLFFAVAKMAPESVSGIGRFGTWINRINNFGAESDYTEITQSNIALQAIATGGLSGKGIGGTECARFLSEAHNDFIFAIIMEEGGIIIALFIIILYITLIYRIFKVAKKAIGDFGTFLAAGIGIVLVLQALINMFVATGLMPVTGQTLPFISYGGTSMVITSYALGIVLNISLESARKKDEDLAKASSLESEPADAKAAVQEESSEAAENNDGEDTEEESYDEINKENNNLNNINTKEDESDN